MGYFKNELIAQDIEVGDRIPAPVPAYAHVALTRRNLRGVESVMFTRRAYVKHIVWSTVGGVVAGLVIGVML